MNRCLAIFVGTLVLMIGAGHAQGQETSKQAGPTTQAAPPASPSGAQPKPADAGTKAPGANQEQPVASNAEFVYAKMSTSKGDIFLELNQAKAPITVKNFLSYVDKGFYTDTIFHRVIDKFMIQGGGMDKSLSEKSTDKAIKNEWQNGLKNVKGSIAMARTSVPDSAKAQFFINIADNAFLDTPRPPDVAAYCVFGRVISGTETLEKIRTVKVAPRGVHEAVPVEPVVITSVTRTTKEEALKGTTPPEQK